MRFALLICDGWGMRFAGTLRGTFELRIFFLFSGYLVGDFRALFLLLVGDLRTQNAISSCGGPSNSAWYTTCGGPSNSARDIVCGGPSNSVRSCWKQVGGRHAPLARLMGGRHAPPLRGTWGTVTLLPCLSSISLCLSFKAFAIDLAKVIGFVAVSYTHLTLPTKLAV